MDAAGGDGHVYPFTSIERKLRSTQIREQLERAIVLGEFKPGERLPSERELSSAFGVSRVSVREALRWLEAVGMITVAAGRGCFVAEARNGFALPLRRWLSIHCNEVLELLKVREALDALAAEEVTRNADASTKARIVDASEAFENAVSSVDPLSVERLVELDMAFHDLLADASESFLLALLVRDLNAYLSEAREITLATDERQRKSAAEHQAIVDAVLAQDPSRARAAAAAHVASARASVMQLVTEDHSQRGSRFTSDNSDAPAD